MPRLTEVLLTKKAEYINQTNRTFNNRARMLTSVETGTSSVITGSNPDESISRQGA
jgi:hypothetical protein